MSFQSIIGQGHAVSALRRAMSSGRVAHAYVFAGHPGVGKMTTAVEFAKALVCARGQDDACDACGPCGKVSRGTHPDVHLIEPQGAGRQIKIDPVREQVIAELALKPYEAKRKIVIIDDAHAMNLSSANCLLKTLEEPPPGSVLILVTPRPDRLPETILSRCHALQFARIGADLIERELGKRGISGATARFLACSSGGSLGRAVQMAEEPGLSELRKSVFGLLAGVHAKNIVGSAAAFVKHVKGLSESKAEARTVAEWMFDLAALFYRDVAVRQLGGPGDALPNADVLDLIDAETAVSRLGIRAILDTIETAKNLLHSNVDLDSVALDAFSRIAACRSHRAA